MSNVAIWLTAFSYHATGWTKR